MTTPEIPLVLEEDASSDGPLDNTVNFSTSLFATTNTSAPPLVVFPATMQMSREIFIFVGYITSEDAEIFYEQALRCPHLKINECMRRQAVDLLNFKILTDTELTIIPRRVD